MADYDDTPLDIAPGLYKEASGYAAKGRYIDGSNVRFWKGYPERIGGFENLVDSGNLTSTITVTITSPAVVTWNNHRLVAGTPVVFTTTGALPTGMTASTTYYVISAGLATNTFRFAATVGGSAINTSGSQSGTHTATVNPAPARGVIAWKSLANIQYAAYGTARGLYLLQGGTITNITPTSGFTIGDVDGSAVFGWSDSTWSNSVWGGVQTLYATTDPPLTWTHAMWGEDLISNPRGQGIFQWDTSTGTSSPSATLSGAPSSALGVFMSDTNRILVAYGAHNGSAADPLLLRWSDSENNTQWTPASTNSAGDIRAEVGSEIIGAMTARGGHLICTDASTYFFRPTGDNLVFALDRIVDGPTMISPHAGIQDALGITYWMGPKSFYFYNGTVTPLPCTVHADVFDNLNITQSFKVCCGTIREFSEVIWFYARTGSNEIDACVAVNTLDGTWWQGTLARTSWLDRSVITDYPIGWAASGLIYAHEYGDTADGSPLSYSLRTGDLDAGDGSFLHGRKFIPDFDRISGSHSLTITVKGYPMRSEVSNGPYTITSSTSNLSIRARGRQVQFLWAGADPIRWGRAQVRARPHGRKE